MTDLDRWHQWIDLLRSWGREVREQPNCWGRNNGIDWEYGDPQGWVNHHFVCGTSPAQSYIDAIVAMLVNGYGNLPGPVVNTFADVNGVVYLIGTGPCNHAGQGASSVLARVRNDQPPLGSAASVGAQDDGVKNHDYAGTETQHPGDGTPYSQALIDALVDINAAAAIVWGWSDSGARSIHHYESTSRKVDMSWHGGPSGTGGPDLRALVAARIAAYRNPAPQWEDDEMLSNDAVKQLSDLIDARVALALKAALTDDATIPVETLDVAATPNVRNTSLVGAVERIGRLVALDVTNSPVKVHPAS